MSTRTPPAALGPEVITACTTVAGVAALVRAPMPDVPTPLPPPRLALARTTQGGIDAGYILQIMVGPQMEVPGIAPTVGYESLHKKTIDQIADGLITLLRSERDPAQGKGN